MKPNRRSIKIKTGTSVVDVKLSGRVERAQTFAKAVIFSLFVLVIVAYMRWNSFMDVKQSNEMSSSTHNDENGVKGLSIKNFESEPSSHVDQDTEYAKQVQDIKVQLQENLKEKVNGNTLKSKINSDNSVSLLLQERVKTDLREDLHTSLDTPHTKETVHEKEKDKDKKRVSLKSGGAITPSVKPAVQNKTPILTELEKVRLNHPKKEVYKSLGGKAEAINKGNNLRRTAGSNKRELPLSTISHATATSSKVSVDPTFGKQVTLLTGAATVTASAVGNLGPPSVVISPLVTDWLKDRWQAAKDMSGSPLPGKHWLEFHLPRPASTLTRVLIDYEVALSNDYAIDVRCLNPSGYWQTVHDSKWSNSALTKKERQGKMHIIHDITIKQKKCNSFDKIKLMIRTPATRFGTSVWRFEAYGILSSQ